MAKTDKNIDISKHIEVQSNLDELIMSSETTEVLKNMLKKLIQEELNNAKVSDSKRDEDGFLVADEMDKHNLKNPNQTTVHAVHERLSPIGEVIFLSDKADNYEAIDLSSKYTVENKLEKYIRFRGLSKKEVAEKIGISGGALSNIISGKFNTSIEICLKLSKLLGISVNELFYLSEFEENRE